MAKATTRPPGGEPPTDESARERPDGLVRRSILAALGQPPGLYDVTVRPLWSNRYRVNVLIGSDATSVRVAHSFFVTAGAAGDILSATPRITRLYA